MLLSSGGNNSYGLHVTYEGKDSRQKIKMIICQLKGNNKWTNIQFVYKDEHLINNLPNSFLYSDYHEIGILIENKKLFLYTKENNNKVWRLSKKIQNIKELKKEFLEFLIQMEKDNLVMV